MRRLVRALGVAMFITGAVSGPVLSQVPSRYSADVNVGFWWENTNGGYKDPHGGGFTGELSVAGRFHSSAAGGVVAALNASHDFKMGWNDSCTLLPDGGCAPELPSMRLFGALAGWETRTGWFRAMGGFAYVDPTSGGGTLAIQARFDAAVWIVRHMALTTYARPAVLPSYRGDLFQILSAGIGIRVR